MELSERDRDFYESDVVFIGHYERDGRAEMLEALIKSGIKLKIFGPYKGFGSSGWAEPMKRRKALQSLAPTTYLSGEQYVKGLSATKIALCFFSKLNRDTYTRRCFEIPAVGAALFCEYSDDIASMYVEGKEAEFFRSAKQLVEKVSYYLQNPIKLKELRAAGRRRVIHDGHDAVSRMREALAAIHEISV